MIDEHQGVSVRAVETPEGKRFIAERVDEFGNTKVVFESADVNAVHRWATGMFRKGGVRPHQGSRFTEGRLSAETARDLLRNINVGVVGDIETAHEEAVDLAAFHAALLRDVTTQGAPKTPGGWLTLTRRLVNDLQAAPRSTFRGPGGRRGPVTP